ncbi:MAG TPA: metal ABC transporter ATP-binding protein [Ilumatobacteraceae bacterium]
MTEAIAVEAADLTIGYAGRAVVSGVDVTVRAGESLALVGVNGSGKSTLLKTIAGLLEPVDGQISVFGDAPGQRPERVAYLGQFHPVGGLLPLQVRDVVMMARYRHHGLLGRIARADRAAVDAAIDRLAIGDLATSSLRSLSGGQQQRVFLAHALARQADLLMLDEPTAGLDAGAIERYGDIIRDELARGAAVVTATHDVRDAARASQVILLAGRVVAAGTPGQVLSAERLSEAFGIELLAVPHGDHTDIVAPHRAHGHDEHNRRVTPPHA